MDDDKPWEHLYDLNYMRFPVDDKFSYSSFGKRVYLLTWGFIISLAVWYTIDGWKKQKSLVPSLNKMKLIKEIQFRRGLNKGMH